MRSSLTFAPGPGKPARVLRAATPPVRVTFVSRSIPDTHLSSSVFPGPLEATMMKRLHCLVAVLYVAVSACVLMFPVGCSDSGPTGANASVKDPVVPPEARTQSSEALYKSGGGKAKAPSAAPKVGEKPN
jgi:hypothetical protein